jgi:hypothetical protein
MITVDTIGRVRRAYFVQGRKIKAIARELKLARADVIINALVRRQKSAPTAPIAVPERLTVALPPIADCAR